MAKRIVLGNILNPLSDTECEYIRGGALVLKQVELGWVVESLGERASVSLEGAEVFDFGEDIVMPSFFDIHFHWVQDDVQHMPQAKLLEWLEKYTFPAERKFEDERYSREKAQTF